MRRGKRGSPGVPVAGAGSQTCDGSLAERKLVRQGVGPRARVRVRAKLGAHERFKPIRPLAKALGQTGQHQDARGLENNTPLPLPPENSAGGGDARQEAHGPGSEPGRREDLGRGPGPPGAALTMSYTLSTTNWLAPILLPAAAASSCSRSVSEGPRPLPPPRTLQGARAGH